MIGSLVERITIRRNTATQGGMGQPLAEWEDYMADVWAEEVQMNGSELVRMGLTLTEDPCVWRIRWREDKTPTTKDRVLRRGTDNYDIRSVREVGGRRRFWEVVGVRRA